MNFTVPTNDASYSVQRPEIGTQSSLKQSSPGCNNPKEAYGEELCANTDDKVKSFPSPSLNAINNAKCGPTKKHFTLRVHGINKPDNSFTSQSGKLTGNKNSAASDKPGPLDRIDVREKIEDRIVSPLGSGIVQSLPMNFVTQNKRKHERISTMGDDTSEVLHQKGNSIVEKGFTESDVLHSCTANMDIEKFVEELEVVEKLELLDVSAIGTHVQNASNVFKKISGTSPMQSSGSKMCSTLHFSFDDLKARRRSEMSRLQASNSMGGRSKIKRPLRMELSPQVETIVSMHMDVLRFRLNAVPFRQRVARLAGLKSPWNCPHGRPTTRHSVDLTSLHKRLDEDDAIA